MSNDNEADVILTVAEAAAIRRRAEADGEARVAEKIGVAPGTLARLIGRMSTRRATVAAARRMLETEGGSQ